MKIPNHGGARVGAGRKKAKEQSKVIRVPESQIIPIQQYLKSLNQTPAPYAPNDSYPVEIRTRLAIPLATERIQAGFPSPAQDHIEKTLDLNEHLIKNANATFIVRVNSLSMLGIGIDINDELIVDRSLDAKHRDIIVALVDNEFTVKRLMIEKDEQWLKAENPDFQDIHFSSEQEFVIWGVVTRVIKKFK